MYTTRQGRARSARASSNRCGVSSTTTGTLLYAVSRPIRHRSSLAPSDGLSGSAMGLYCRPAVRTGMSGSIRCGRARRWRRRRIHKAGPGLHPAAPPPSPRAHRGRCLLSKDDQRRAGRQRGHGGHKRVDGRVPEGGLRALAVAAPRAEALAVLGGVAEVAPQLRHALVVARRQRLLVRRLAGPLEGRSARCRASIWQPCCGRPAHQCQCMAEATATRRPSGCMTSAGLPCWSRAVSSCR